MKPRRTPPKRTHVQHAAEESSPVILSHEEKHELIRAHADARRARPEKMGLGYYIAVAASCLVVVSGWIYTLDRGLWTPPSKPDPTVQQLEDNVERLKVQWEKAKADAAAVTVTSTKP